MEKPSLKHRAVIEFLVKEGNGPKQINERMVAAYGDSSPSYYTIKYWAKQFKWGRESIEDDPRSGRPVNATAPEVVAKVEEIVLLDRRSKASQLAKECGISESSVLKILHEHLGMTKVSARWVPRMLTPCQKATRVLLSRENLDWFEKEGDLFLSRIVTGDETWIHHWDPETKQESMQWKHKGSPPPKKFRTQPSAGKIMATIFWDMEGVLMIDYLPHKETITGAYYAQVLEKLKEAILEKRRGKCSRGVLLLHDNAPVHKSRIAKAAVKDLGFIELNHPPYSPDLAPSDFYLFRHLKKKLRGRRFSDDNEVKCAVSSFFADSETEFFSEGIRAVTTKWKKCIDLKGDYIEKQ